MAAEADEAHRRCEVLMEAAVVRSELGTAAPVDEAHATAMAAGTAAEPEEPASTSTSAESLGFNAFVRQCLGGFSRVEDRVSSRTISAARAETRAEVEAMAAKLSRTEAALAAACTTLSRHEGEAADREAARAAEIEALRQEVSAVKALMAEAVEEHRRSDALVEAAAIVQSKPETAAARAEVDEAHATAKAAGAAAESLGDDARAQMEAGAPSSGTDSTGGSPDSTGESSSHRINVLHGLVRALQAERKTLQQQVKDTEARHLAELNTEVAGSMSGLAQVIVRSVRTLEAEQQAEAARIEAAAAASIQQISREEGQKTKDRERMVRQKDEAIAQRAKSQHAQTSAKLTKTMAQLDDVERRFCALQEASASLKAQLRAAEVEASQLQGRLSEYQDALQSKEKEQESERMVMRAQANALETQVMRQVQELDLEKHARAQMASALRDAELECQNLEAAFIKQSVHDADKLMWALRRKKSSRALTESRRDQGTSSGGKPLVGDKEPGTEETQSHASEIAHA